jgi:hypothetical protein
MIERVRRPARVAVVVIAAVLIDWIESSTHAR